MNKTWISVNGTAVNGWAEGPEAPTDGWIQFDWRPEKSFDGIDIESIPCDPTIVKALRSIDA